MVDEAVVADKLQYRNRYTNELKQIRGLSKEAYIEELVTQRVRSLRRRIGPAPLDHSG